MGSIERGTFFYKILSKVDSFWMAFDGFVSDFERLDWIYYERPLFSRDGLIKADISLIPFRDRQLKRIAAKYGGWIAVTSQNFDPSEELYQSLERIGLGRNQFDLSRRYLANPSEYRASALKAKRGT